MRDTTEQLRQEFAKLGYEDSIARKGGIIGAPGPVESNRRKKSPAFRDGCCYEISAEPNWSSRALVASKEVALNLYFFMADGIVKNHQIDERDYHAVRICTILDPIPEE